jgi:hypothetical protein
LNQLRVYLQKKSNKFRKEKGKRKEKRGKGPRGKLWPRPGKWPTAHLSLSPGMVRPLFLFLADAWDPLGSADIIFNPHPIFSLRDSVITPNQSN